ncbi:hypothetical protein BUALT_Bualt01G0167100 [Buddleja alternifolia]|uniref:Uncharacterized protein n=1 Tax=Buddleja alternifolia TaxID=168488 RepID=A0AAV6Y7Q5_9LAMI|nr:hypothetical protein BUALT_Bualt01G0167100 [Buddleja alternifolia]
MQWSTYTLHESKTVYVNHIMRRYHDFTIQGKAYPKARIFMINRIDGIELDLNELLEKLRVNANYVKLGDPSLANMNVVDDTNNVDEENVHNPLYVKSKGFSNTRLPNHWDPKSERAKGNVEFSRNSLSSKAKGKLSSTLAPIPIGERAGTLMAPCGDYPGVPLLGPWDALTMHQETDRPVQPTLNHGYGASLASQRGGRLVENPPRVGDHTSGVQA